MKSFFVFLVLICTCLNAQPIICNASVIDTLESWDKDLEESWEDLQLYVYTNAQGQSVLTLWGPQLEPWIYIDEGGSLSSGGVHEFRSSSEILKVEGTLEGLRITPKRDDDRYISIAFRCSEGY